MKKIWSFNLPAIKNSRACDFESPIIEYRNEVLFYLRTKQKAVLYVINAETGKPMGFSIDTGIAVMPKECFYEPFLGGVAVYAGDMFWYAKGKLKHAVDMSVYGKVISHTVRGYFIYMLCNNNGKYTLICFDAQFLNIVWETEVTHDSGTPGPIYVFEEKVTCYSGGELLFMNLAKGTVMSSIKVPDVERLFCPVRLYADYIAIGYTDANGAGILKYDTKAEKVVWKTGRNLGGPLFNCRIYGRGNNLYWSKNDTELICIDANTGAEKYAVATSPRLNSDLLFDGDSIVFVTEGPEGTLTCISADTGAEKWKLPLNNGRLYPKKKNDSLYVGDYSKRILQIDANTGKVIAELQTAGEAVGRIEVLDNALYTVVWGGGTAGNAIIKVDLGTKKKSLFSIFRKH